MNLPEVNKLRDVVYIAKNEQDFTENVKKALEENCPEKEAERKRIARQSDWTNKMIEIQNLIKPHIVH